MKAPGKGVFPYGPRPKGNSVCQRLFSRYICSRTVGPCMIHAEALRIADGCLTGDAR
jgi:hypothetical protein